MELHDISKSNSNAQENILNDVQLKELQRLSIMILDDVDKICKEINIKYLLIGGSAIGALRHKGFIPWDDDIDIAMTRNDYLIFKKHFSKCFEEKYTISDALSLENYGRVIPKIRINGTVYRTILEQDLNNCGIRMDIFIIENTYNNTVLRDMHGLISMFMGFALSCRRLYLRRKEFKFLPKNLSFTVKKIFGFFFSGLSIEKWALMTDNWYGKCKDDNSKFVTLPSDVHHFFGEIEKRSDILPGYTVEFEGRKLKIPSNYDAYLNKRYPGYMEIPSEDKRIRSKYTEFDLGLYEKENKSC